MKILRMLLGLALIVSACGSSDGESAGTTTGATTESHSFGSSDGVVDVFVPEGAAPASFVGSATPVDAGSIGVNLEADQGVALAYDLGTSGTTFNEPVTVTFRISPDDGAFDPDLGLPFATLLIEDGDGAFQFLGDTQASLDGETLVLEGTTTHFSNVVAYVSDEAIAMDVGAQYEVGVSFQPKIVLNSGDPLEGSVSWTALSDRISVDGTLPLEADAVCEIVGPDTIQATVVMGDSALLFLSVAFTFNDDPDNYEDTSYIRSDVECVEAPEEATGTASEVPPGQDPRAHVTDIEPVATANSTVGLRATFAEPWGMEPPLDLFSFFVLFNILQGNLSALAGWEVHNEVVTPYGPGPTFLMNDGSVVMDTGFPIGPGSPIDVNGQNGSWLDEASSSPVFGEFTFMVDPSEPLEPIDMDDAVWDLVTQMPLPNGGPP